MFSLLNWMPDLWLEGVIEWYEYIKERDMPEDGFLNLSNCSLRHSNIEDKSDAINLKGQGKKNEQRMQTERSKHGPSNIPGVNVGITNDPGIAGC